MSINRMITNQEASGRSRVMMVKGYQITTNDYNAYMSGKAASYFIEVDGNIIFESDNLDHCVNYAISSSKVKVGDQMKTSSMAQYKYKQKNVKQCVVDLNLKTDADIILKLDTMPNKAGYVKQLIRKDIDAEVLEMEEKKMLYVGIVRDDLKSLEDKRTKIYATYKEAHDAAEKLCKKTYGDRGSIVVEEVEQ